MIQTERNKSTQLSSRNKQKNDINKQSMTCLINTTRSIDKSGGISMRKSISKDP